MNIKKRRRLTSFGLKARCRMLEMNISTVELANAVGCSPTYITDIFTGYKSGAKYLNKIYEILDIEKCEFDDYMYGN